VVRDRFRLRNRWWGQLGDTFVTSRGGGGFTIAMPLVVSPGVDLNPTASGFLIERK